MQVPAQELTRGHAGSSLHAYYAKWVVGWWRVDRGSVARARALAQFLDGTGRHLVAVDIILILELHDFETAQRWREGRPVRRRIRRRLVTLGCLRDEAGHIRL